MLSFECIKNEKSVYFLLTSAPQGSKWATKARTAQELPKKRLGKDFLHTPPHLSSLP